MKVALIADLHGNLVAAETILGELERQEPDQVVCLGDVAYGPCPAEVVDVIRGLDCPVVVGNGDAWNVDPEILEGERAYRGGAGEKQREVHREINGWLRSRLNESQLAWMAGFTCTWETQLAENVTLLCYHGSPRHHFDFILPTTSEATVDEMLAGRRATLMVGGHTHQQMLRRHRADLLINAGSVGKSPMSVPWPDWAHGRKETTRYASRAEYAVLDVHDGAVKVGLHHVGLDGQSVEEMLRDSGMPHTETYFGAWTRSG